MAHVSMAHPATAAAADLSGRGGGSRGDSARARGGTYLCMEGPQFSSLPRARPTGRHYSVIGMTNMPEAKLAREAETVTPASPW